MMPMKPRKTFTLTPDGDSQNQLLPEWTAGAQVQFWNSGGVVCFIAFGSAADTAATGDDHPIPPGAIITFTRETYQNYLAAYCTTSVVLSATCGDGA